jgi:hypothetical protein
MLDRTQNQNTSGYSYNLKTHTGFSFQYTKVGLTLLCIGIMGKLRQKIKKLAMPAFLFTVSFFICDYLMLFK